MNRRQVVFFGLTVILSAAAGFYAASRFYTARAQAEAKAHAQKLAAISEASEMVYRASGELCEAKLAEQRLKFERGKPQRDARGLITDVMVCPDSHDCDTPIEKLLSRHLRVTYELYTGNDRCTGKPISAETKKTLENEQQELRASLGKINREVLNELTPTLKELYSTFIQSMQNSSKAPSPPH